MDMKWNTKLFIYVILFESGACLTKKLDARLFIYEILFGNWGVFFIPFMVSCDFREFRQFWMVYQVLIPIISCYFNEIFIMTENKLVSFTQWILTYSGLLDAKLVQQKERATGNRRDSAITSTFKQWSGNLSQLYFANSS